MGNQKYPEMEEINGYTIFFHATSRKWAAERSGIIHATHNNRENVVAFAQKSK